MIHLELLRQPSGFAYPPLPPPTTAAPPPLHVPNVPFFRSDDAEPDDKFALKRRLCVHTKQLLARLGLLSRQSPPPGTAPVLWDRIRDCVCSRWQGTSHPPTPTIPHSPQTALCLILPALDVHFLSSIRFNSCPHTPRHCRTQQHRHVGRWKITRNVACRDDEPSPSRNAHVRDARDRVLPSGNDTRKRHDPRCA